MAEAKAPEPTQAQRRVIRWLDRYPKVNIYWHGSEDDRPQFDQWWRAGYGEDGKGTPRLTTATFWSLVRNGWIAPARVIPRGKCTARVVLYRPTAAGLAAIGKVVARG